MENINHLIEDLRSTEKDARNQASKKLSRVSKLPNEAINALGLVTLDFNRNVARQARFTLWTYRLKKIFRGLLYGLLVIVGLSIFLFMIIETGKTAQLTCERAKSGAAVVCLENSNLYYLLPWTEREIRDVQGAEIMVETDDDDMEFYNIKLITGDGEVFLNSGYTYEYSSKRHVADQINEFVKSDVEGRLVLSDPGALTLGNAFIVGLPLLFCLAYGLLHGLSKLWEKRFPHSSNNSKSAHPPVSKTSEQSLRGEISLQKILRENHRS